MKIAMKKVIYLEPIAVKNCLTCIYHYNYNGYKDKDKNIHCCTQVWIGEKDIPKQERKNMVRAIADDNFYYATLTDPEVIPEWCPLEDYPEETK